MNPGEFPHSEICGSTLICSSPQLIAAYHVFLRLPVPRHSPCALLRLTVFLALDSPTCQQDTLQNCSFTTSFVSLAVIIQFSRCKSNLFAPSFLRTMHCNLLIQIKLKYSYQQFALQTPEQVNIHLKLGESSFIPDCPFGKRCHVAGIATQHHAHCIRFSPHSCLNDGIGN